jgi:hypothetical protein
MRPASKNSGTFYEPIVAGLPDDARAPAAGDFGPIAAITPLATDKVCECPIGDVHGSAACACIQSVLPSGGIKHSGMEYEGAADCLSIKLSKVVVR